MITQEQYDALKAERDALAETVAEFTAERETISSRLSLMESKLSAIKSERDALAAQVRVLRKALNDQLNDCINFDNGNLTHCIMESSTAVLNMVPQQCLNEIIVEARRVGFIAGADSIDAIQAIDSSEYIADLADEYAAQLRKGGV